MLVIKFLRWLYKVLNGEQHPSYIALGLTLGFCFGLVPFGFLTLVGLLLFLIVRCHFGSALFGLAAGLGLGALFITRHAAHPIGELILSNGPHGLFLSLAESDVLSLFRLHQSATIGGIALALLIAWPLFAACKKFVLWFRGTYSEKLGKSKTFKWISNTVLFRILRWLVVGATA